MASGGPRTPSAPAPVSGPGRLSKRTDGTPGGKLSVAPGLAYGERQEALAQERTAPMAVTPQTAAPSPPTVGAPAQPSTPTGATNQAVNMMFAQSTQRPNEPVTHGVDIGPGAGPEIMPSPVQQQQQGIKQGPITQMLQGLSATSTSGSLAQLYQAAMTRGV